MKTIKKIVFTGGPCSGKTTFTSRAEEIFAERGYRVIIDHESATDLISGGISPATMGMYEFQKYCVALQLKKEEICMRAAFFSFESKARFAAAVQLSLYASSSLSSAASTLVYAAQFTTASRLPSIEMGDVMSRNSVGSPSGCLLMSVKMKSHSGCSCAMILISLPSWPLAPVISMFIKTAFL